MPIYEVTQDEFRRIGESSFAAAGLMERGDIQRLLRVQIEVIAEDLYVLAEEFGEWDESKRRIDLLAVDRNANLVVLEIKRTADGGHMDLQAIRYAAMVSAMTFERAIQVHARFLGQVGEDASTSETRIREFLGWEAEDEEFGEDTRIVLVAADFSKELTTSVLWMIEHGIDIRCVRVRPYDDGGRTLVDVQQIIPLPEADDYQIQIRAKDRQERQQRAERYNLRKRFWQGLIAAARARGTRHGNLSPREYNWLGASSGVRGLGFNYVIVRDSVAIELYIDRQNQNENEAVFDQIAKGRQTIEGAFGSALDWQRLEGKRACRIRHTIELGGYRSPEGQWPSIWAEMVDRMEAFERALLPAIQAIEV